LRHTHIVLVGLPGAGKTTVGQAAAAALGWPFVDLDAEIERRSGMSVAAIFERHGEAHFRALERDATEELIGAPPAVVAPGGGWMTVPETVALLRPTACIIYLRVTPATALRRLGAGYRTRPLLGGEPMGPAAAIEGLYARRRGAYEAADRMLDTELLIEQGVIDKVVQLALATRVA
jgi:shikimate kinase